MLRPSYKKGLSLFLLGALVLIMGFQNCGRGQGLSAFASQSIDEERALAVEVQDRGAFKLIEGDMLVDRDFLDEMGSDPDEGAANEINDAGSRQGSKAGRNLADLGASYWRNGLLPLRFESGFTSAQKNLVMNACQAWSSVANVKCVLYNAKTHTGTWYVNVTKTGAGCYATYGKPKNKPGYMNLSEKETVSYSLPKGTCLTKGIAMHEIGHLLGMIHENNRPDRDKFVTINKANLVSSCSSLTSVFQASQVVRVGKAYDFKSIMHYASRHCSKNGRATIVPKPSYDLGAYVLGDAVLKTAKLSAQDKAFAVEVYGKPPP